MEPEPETEQICIIDTDGAILSNYSPKDTNPFFTPGSFSFRQMDNRIIIQMSPIFIWKLMQQMKMTPGELFEIDHLRLRTFASYFMKSNVADLKIYVYEDTISYTIDGKIRSIETDKYYPTVLHAYNLLYADTRQMYNTPCKTSEMLKECSDILLLLSDPARDKRAK
jgi:hypothetical protein